MQQQSMGALQALDNPRGGGRFLDGQRLARTGGWHEAEHHQVGIGIDKHIADEGIRSETLQMIQSSRQCGSGAAFGLRKTEWFDALWNRGRPGAGRIHEMTLDIENELVASQHARGRLGFQRRNGGQCEATAELAGAGVGPIHGQQRGRRTRQRDQETAPVLPQPAGVDGRLGHGVAARQFMHRLQRHRHELAVAGAVELDRQAQALGVDSFLHGKGGRNPCR